MSCNDMALRAYSFAVWGSVVKTYPPPPPSLSLGLKLLRICFIKKFHFRPLPVSLSHSQETSFQILTRVSTRCCGECVFAYFPFNLYISYYNIYFKCFFLKVKLKRESSGRLYRWSEKPQEEITRLWRRCMMPYLLF